MASVLICAGRPTVRVRLGRALSGMPGVDAVDVVGSGEAVLSRWRERAYDLVLLSFDLPELPGLDTAERLLRTRPDARVVMLTEPADGEQLVRAFAAGVQGYVSSDAGAEELTAAVATALAVSTGAPAARSSAASAVILTEREWQVLAGMSVGKSKAEIGRDLYVSEDTVKTHARHLFQKLEVADRAHAVAAGFRQGLLR